MILKVVGTGSKGNSYILENEKEALIIECGVSFQHIKKAIDFNLSKVVGCLVTHEHKDHSKSINDLMNNGINVFASKGTHEACETLNNRRAVVITGKEIGFIGSFTILPFDVKHDAAEPLGFILSHEETGKVLFLTDTYYCSYTFKNLNNIIIEANYSKAIIDSKMKSGDTKKFLRDRVLRSHFSLENCKDMLSANDLSKVNNIVLIHLSDSNSNEVEFQKEVFELTGKTVTVANNGLQMKFNKTPF